MQFNSVKVACFSPTGTTKAVAVAIAGGLGSGRLDVIDATRPDTRARPLRVGESDLLVIAVPVYMGRVPDLVGEWLNAIEARNTPTVCTVVYGNRAFEDALLELKDIMIGRGCIPVAGAAFIGEHSFSSAEAPVAAGRPDQNDLALAKAFGQSVRRKLQAFSSPRDVPIVDVPGNHPYNGDTKTRDIDFIEVNDWCDQCGVCIDACPAGAIDQQDPRVIDVAACITCCACIKLCPNAARTMKPGPIMDVAIRLNRLCGTPKAPEYFL